MSTSIGALQNQPFPNAHLNPAEKHEKEVFISKHISVLSVIPDTMNEKWEFLARSTHLHAPPPTPGEALWNGGRGLDPGL